MAARLEAARQQAQQDYQSREATAREEMARQRAACQRASQELAALRRAATLELQQLQATTGVTISRSCSAPLSRWISGAAAPARTPAPAQAAPAPLTLAACSSSVCAAAGRPAAVEPKAAAVDAEAAGCGAAPADDAESDGEVWQECMGSIDALSACSSRSQQGRPRRRRVRGGARAACCTIM